VVELLWAAANRRLSAIQLKTRSAHALCVVIAARGYPNSYPKGDPIGFPHVLPTSVTIFHAGTARNSTGQIVTNGGRVLGVTALAPTLHHAAVDAYAVCEAIQCSSKYFRRDIGARQLRRA
jgi:phosphoribosylamine--glycine ligase